jgi:hypothetical protein
MGLIPYEKFKNATIINCTEHDVVETCSGETFPADKEKNKRKKRVARVITKSKIIRTINGIPAFETDFEPEVAGLPEPQENTFYIVSSLCLEALNNSRYDVIAPGKPKRDEETKKIIGCVNFRVQTEYLRADKHLELKSQIRELEYRKTELQEELKQLTYKK